MVSKRRWAGENSEVRTALIEAAEQLMRDEGYPAVTARNLADKVGLTRQIVHYYFSSMDELFIAMIRQSGEKARVQLHEALASEDPLRALWNLNRDPSQSILSMEMNALANRRPAVRAEVAKVAEEFRDIQVRGLTDLLEGRGVTAVMPPDVSILLLTSLAQVLTVEEAIDVTRGHANATAFVQKCLEAFNEGRQTPFPSIALK
jgi:AcrR family transcriptional regulator